MTEKIEKKALKNMIEYQNDSVVSTTIIKKKTGTVTLFGFDEGQELSEHTAPFEAVVIIIDGKADILIGTEHHTVEEGEMIKLPADVPHALTALTPFKMLLVMVRS